MTRNHGLRPLWNEEFSPLAAWGPTWGSWGDAMERLINAPFATPSRESQWTPQVDVKETEDAYVFHAEVPGVSPEDIEVSVTPNGIRLAGTKMEEEKKEGDDFVKTERRYGSFSRSFAFPDVVDPEKVEASTKDGILTVKVAKSRPNKPQRIEVRGK